MDLIVTPCRRNRSGREPVAETEAAPAEARRLAPPPQNRTSTHPGVALSRRDWHSRLNKTPGAAMPELSLPSRPIESPSAWMRRDLHTEDWQVVLSAGCLDEIGRAVDALRAYPLPT